MRYGLDFSHWQYTHEEPSGIDYEVAVAAGIEFVVARTTNGKTYDKRFQRHFDGAVAAGLMAAGYHYFRPRYGNQNQMDSINEVLDGRKPSFYSLDVETSDGRDAPEVRDDVWRMLDLLGKNLDCPIIIYTAEWFWGDKIRDKIMLRDFTHHQPKPRANYYPLWMAWYPTDAEGIQLALPMGNPVLPRGWRAGSYGEGPYAERREIWQYTSKLIIPGLGGSATVDGNEMGEDWWVVCGGEPTDTPPVDPPDDPIDPVDPPTDEPWGVIYKVE